MIFLMAIIDIYQTHTIPGKILAFGSGHMFQDKYITNEMNMEIWDYCLNILVTKDLTFKMSEFSDLEVEKQIMELSCSL
jgi:intraflagellar transport protein 52